MSFKHLVIDPTRYQLTFQESEPVYVFQEGVFGDDRQQERDPDTGFGHWTVRVTASDAVNREEQALEVRVVAKDKPEAGFRDEVVMPNLRVQIYSTRQQRGVTARWFADAVAPASASAGKSKPAAPPATAKAAA